MRALTETVFQMIVWSWTALGLGCLLAEGLPSGPSDGLQPVAVPVQRVLVTPFGPAGS